MSYARRRGDGHGHDGHRDRIGCCRGAARGRLPGVDDRPVREDDQSADVLRQGTRWNLHALTRCRVRVDDDQSAHWPFSAQRRFDFRRLVSVFDTYLATGRVDLSCRKRGGGGTHPESCEFTALAAAWNVNIDGRDLARATRDAYGRVSRAYLGIAAFAIVDMMREAVNAATPAINSQPRSGSPRTSSKPSTASDSASSLSRGISQATPAAQARIRFLGTAAGRSVFVRVHAPHRALTTGGVTMVVCDAAQRAGLGRIYAHRLRHTAATVMLRAQPAGRGRAGAAAPLGVDDRDLREGRPGRAGGAGSALAGR